MQVYHEEGLLFQKIEGEAGISYLSVEDKVVSKADRDILVRHGNPVTGNCGYYPLGLLMADRETQKRAAARRHKLPPSQSWVESTRKFLTANGVVIH